MRLLSELLAQNRAWSAEIAAADPGFFTRLAEQQAPRYLWIGCGDSRVPANQIVGLMPGEMFVHRNIANVVVPSDLNCLSVLQYGIEVLGVHHLIICGHYGCGGVLAVLRGERLGLVDNWLCHVETVRRRYRGQLAALNTESERHARLCELNVVAQVLNAARTTVVRDAWRQGRELAVHGWIYALRDGLLHDLEVTVTSDEEVAAVAERVDLATPPADAR
mgnify:CR=1 FL=1